MIRPWMLLPWRGIYALWNIRKIKYVLRSLTSGEVNDREICWRRKFITHQASLSVSSTRRRKVHFVICHWFQYWVSIIIRMWLLWYSWISKLMGKHLHIKRALAFHRPIVGKYTLSFVTDFNIWSQYIWLSFLCCGICIRMGLVW